jgi:hypothetical protein
MTMIQMSLSSRSEKQSTSDTGRELDPFSHVTPIKGNGRGYSTVAHLGLATSQVLGTRVVHVRESFPKRLHRSLPSMTWNDEAHLSQDIDVA